MSNIPTFTAAKRDAAAEPIGFYVGNDPVAFSVPRPVPATPLLEMAEAADDGDEAAALVAFQRFMKGCLDSDVERRRLIKAMTQARMGAEDLLPLVQYLVAEGMGRPTTPPSLSPDSRPSDGGSWNTAGSELAPPAPSPL